MRARIRTHRQSGKPMSFSAIKVAAPEITDLRTSSRECNSHILRSNMSAALPTPERMSGVSLRERLSIDRRLNEAGIARPGDAVLIDQRVNLSGNLFRDRPMPTRDILRKMINRCRPRDCHNMFTA